MSNWIKMRTDLAADPRVIWVAAKLACNPCWVTGALHYLWALFDQYTKDGILRLYTPEMINSRVGLPGFIECLAAPEIGWVLIDPDFLQVVDFEKHNGASAKKRAQGKNRVAKHRVLVTRSALPEKNREEKNRSDEIILNPHRLSPSRESDVADGTSNIIAESFRGWCEQSRHHFDSEKFEKPLQELIAAAKQLRVQDTSGDQLIQRAIKRLIAEGLNFTNISYATTCVLNRVKDWSRGKSDPAPSTKTRKTELARQRVAARLEAHT